jgi:hypothetical protein
MKRSFLILLWIALLATGCGNEPVRSDSISAAEAFIDAFYAWDSVGLSALTSPGRDADNVLYYQGWAEAANYVVKERRPCSQNDQHEVVCAVTVTDDFGKALGYTATDTFTMIVRDGMVTDVSFAGDDPPVFEELFEWLASRRPQVFTGPGKDMFNGGTTPGDCARAVAQAAREFAALH